MSDAIIGVCTIRLQLPGLGSLKEKRSVLKSMLARMHNTFNVSAAEVGQQDVWQSSIIGVAAVSNSSVHAQQVIGSILKWIEANYPDVYISSHETEIL